MQNSIHTNTDIVDLLFMNILEQFYRMLYVLIYDFAEAQTEIVLLRYYKCVIMNKKKVI